MPSYLAMVVVIKRYNLWRIFTYPTLYWLLLILELLMILYDVTYVRLSYAYDPFCLVKYLSGHFTRLTFGSVKFSRLYIGVMNYCLACSIFIYWCHAPLIFSFFMQVCGQGQDLSIWSISASDCIAKISTGAPAQDVLFDDNQVSPL